MAYDVPQDTMDIRYPLCTDHHPACDCREAELAEQLHEYRSEIQRVKKAAARLLVGHRLRDYGDLATQYHSRAEMGGAMYDKLMAGDGPLACQCTGCQLVRATELLVLTDDDGVVTTDAERFIR